jgi:hypothetical protein
MAHVIQVAAFSGMVCTIASVALAAAPGFQGERTSFGCRFLFFLWRFSLPAWVVLESTTLVFAGWFYP